MDPMQQKINELQLKAKQYIYIVLIFIVSLLVLIVLPLLNVGNEAPSLDIPKTRAAWIMFIALRVVISFINVFIYVMFIRQGKSNAISSDNFKEATRLLGKTKVKAITPRSPTKFTTSQYGFKSVGIVGATGFALVALPPIVAYDWKMAATYLFVIVMNVVFGIYQMKVTEAYWSEEYLNWVNYIIESEKVAQIEQKEVNQNVRTQQQDL